MDIPKAIEWYKRCGEQDDDANSINALIRIYESAGDERNVGNDNHFVKRDDRKLAHFCFLAAKRGDHSSQLKYFFNFSFDLLSNEKNAFILVFQVGKNVVNRRGTSEE